ncbi:hypothetical protein SDC9_181098 [bioreactor metagenome]|uniref:Uncharacterized protein n=1 Tax=bioreactor metagenome TaxID=1076179 RepID=A0A645H6A5_9ZZZZ
MLTLIIPSIIFNIIVFSILKSLNPLAIKLGSIKNKRTEKINDIIRLILAIILSLFSLNLFSNHLSKVDFFSSSSSKNEAE